MSNLNSPFGLPLEAGPLQGIDLGDPSNTTDRFLPSYRVNPPNPEPLFSAYSVYVHDELGILQITGMGKTNKNDKYGQAVRGDFDRVVKSLDGKYGANLRHIDIVNEPMPVGDQSGFARTFDYLKPSSIWKDDDDFLRALQDGDRLLVKSYSLEGYDPLSKITVEAKALSRSESYLTVMYQATSYGRILKEAQSAQDDEAF